MEDKYYDCKLRLRPIVPVIYETADVVLPILSLPAVFT